jgi:hypothetical protein
VTSPTPTRGPCSPWDATFCCELTAAAIPISGSMLMAATELLYNLTAQQFDICEFTVRPCRDACGGIAPYGGWGNWWEWGGSGGGLGVWPVPWNYNGMWFNLTCGQCMGSCSCTALEQAMLPGPVASIVSVKLDGASMPASAYRVDDYRKLMRVDGGMWPVCQDLNLPDTEPNTWSVTFTVGQAVPAIGKLAAGELACEMIKSCLGLPCALPRNATQINRQGVTIEFPLLADLLKNGLLGLTYTDMFISAYNPNRLAAPPQVYDVDFEPWRRTTS